MHNSGHSAQFWSAHPTREASATLPVASSGMPAVPVPVRSGGAGMPLWPKKHTFIFASCIGCQYVWTAQRQRVGAESACFQKLLLHSSAPVWSSALRPARSRGDPLTVRQPGLAHLARTNISLPPRAVLPAPGMCIAP